MNTYLIGFAYFCLFYNTIFVSILIYDKLFGRQPLTFLEVWLYLEDKFANLGKLVEEENKEVRKKIVDSLWNSEERSMEHLKDELKKFKNDKKS